MPSRFHKTLTLWGGLCLLPQTVWSDFQSGSQLLQNCTQEKDIQAQAYCVGYVAAIADVLGGGKGEISGWRACLPSDATQGDIVKITVDWLQQHSSVHSAGASDNVAHALAKAYPCNP